MLTRTSQMEEILGKAPEAVKPYIVEASFVGGPTKASTDNLSRDQLQSLFDQITTAYTSMRHTPYNLASAKLMRTAADFAETLGIPVEQQRRLRAESSMLFCDAAKDFLSDKNFASANAVLKLAQDESRKAKKFDMLRILESENGLLAEAPDAQV